MSWQDYVNAYLVNFTDVNTNKTALNVGEHGAIVGNVDGAVWAATPGFTLESYSVEVPKDDDSGNEKVDVNEFATLVDTYQNKGFTNKKGGLRMHKEKYYLVSFDDSTGVMYLKKSGGGAAVAKSNLGFVIATYASAKKLTNFNGVQENQNPGVLNKAVEALQKFLLENNL